VLKFDCNQQNSKVNHKIRQIIDELMTKRQPATMYQTTQAQHLTGASEYQIESGVQQLVALIDSRD
jgi:hypothetical protein